jgi:hypothetical protein
VALVVAAVQAVLDKLLISMWQQVAMAELECLHQSQDLLLLVVVAELVQLKEIRLTSTAQQQLAVEQTQLEQQTQAVAAVRTMWLQVESQADLVWSLFDTQTHTQISHQSLAA